MLLPNQQRPAIADAAVAAQRFVNPFSLKRMTWITRAGWDEALSQAVLTTPEVPV